MKSKNVKRFLAILSACAIVVTGTPVTANAAELSDVAIESELSDAAVNADEAEVNEDSAEESSEEEAEELTKENEENKEVAVEVPMVTPLQAATAMAASVVESASTNNASESVIADEQVQSEESGQEGVAAPIADTETAKIEVDEQSGFNAYHAIASEFTTTNVDDNTVLATKFTPSLNQSYDVVILPGTMYGKSVQYGSDFMKQAKYSTSDCKLYMKGIILESGATMITSEPKMNITYVRFESGAKAATAVNTFNGWERLTEVVGFGEALKAYGNDLVSFKDTFSGCAKLTSEVIDLSGMTASFDNTFSNTTALNSVEIKNGSISNISNLWNRSLDVSSGSSYNKHMLTISEITFPSNETSYLSHAFTNMWGSLVFNNCKSGDSQLLNFDEAYAGSAIPSYKESHDNTGYGSYEPGNGSIYDYKNFENNFIKITGAKAYSAKSMFESAGFISVDLSGFITSDTVALDKMFKGATFAEIKGVNTWKLGALTADEMFASTRVYFGPQSYLTKTLIPEIKKLDWSKCTSANKLFNFTYKGNCPIDYSGMDLSGVENITISGLNDYDFITPAKAPQNYVFEQGSVYELRAGSTLGGKALDPVEVTDGKVAGSAIKSNTHVYTDYATISITDVSSDKEVSTAVVPGYKLSEYLDSKIAYYQDRSLTQTVSPELVVNTGDKVTLYCMLSTDGVNREVIDDAEVDFGENLDNVEITLEDNSKDKLQGGNADLTIKIETANKNTSAVIPSSVQKFAKSSFFNIDLIATVGGVDKKVSEMSQKATISLPLPNDYESGAVKVLNYHDGFDKSPIVIDATVDKSAGLVTFETDKFSPYVMIYGEKSGSGDEETDTVDITVKWSGDSKDKTGRKDIDISLTAIYEDDSTVELTEKYVADTTKDESKVTFTYPKSNSGSPFKVFEFMPTADININGYTASFDRTTYTYTLKYSPSFTREKVNVTVDLTSLSDKDMNTLAALAGNDRPEVRLYVKYDNNSTAFIPEHLDVNASQRIYNVEIDLFTNSPTGLSVVEYTRIDFATLAIKGYEKVVDMDNMKITLVSQGVDSSDTTRHNFAVKVVDNSNSGKTRPDKLEVRFVAKYGNYTRNKTVVVNLAGMTGNTTNAYVEFPTSVSGVNMTFLDAMTNTGTDIGYSSEWDNAARVFKYILNGASDTDPDPSVTIDPVDVMVNFVGGTADSRPNKVTVTIADSNNQNTVTKEIATPFAPNITAYKESFNRLVNDTYHVAGVSGVNAALYKVEYNGLNVTITYTGNQNVITTPTTKKTVTINMDDSNNEDGLRPKSMKITVANKDGSDTITSDITIGDSNSSTYQIDVKNPNDEYTVKSVSGMPESYTVTMSGLTITCKHTVEKITKTFKVEWSGDGDNADKTRPTSVQLTIKNGGSSVTTATVSADTNWTANVSLNKLIKGVEASYTVEGADVTNYSKSSSGDTVTYKFTGTLSKDAAAIEANKNGGINAASVDGMEELSFDIANFDWIDYANRYPDLKKAYGYNKEALYAHYIRYGIGEGRVATFTGKYATVNEDILKAYFPEDYKYKTNLSSTNEEYLIGADKTTTSATSSANRVTVDSNGNVHTTVKNPDGTTTETITDADGNIISVSTYKTGDLRMEDLSMYFVILGVLMLIAAALIVRVVIKDDKRKKAVLSMIS